MRSNGIGLQLPILHDAGKIAGALGVSTGDEGAPGTLRLRHSGQLSVQCEGDSVVAQTSRTIYRATVGVVYTPIGEASGKLKDKTPKKLIAVGRVGDEWMATVSPEAGAAGRTRGMLLWSFLARYIPHEPRVRTPVKPRKLRAMKTTPTASQLDRLERKMDAILTALGVTVGEAS